MKKILHIVKRALVYFLIFILAIFILLWVWNIFVDELPEDKVNFGTTFSNYYADELGLDWKEAYLAILDDLEVKSLRVVAYWREIEPLKGETNYDSLDFQIKEASKRDIELIVSIGQKVPRWPECHIPDWARQSPKEEREKAVLNHIERTVNRYKNVEAIKYWQVENEPFLGGFGDCPAFDKDFLDEEIKLVRLIDDRPILTTDSGELGDWIRAKNRGDIFGTTMYRDVWFKRTIRFTYPLPPTWFKFKDFVSNLFTSETATKDIIVIEMQAEAWGRDPIPYLTLEQQLKYMDFDRFKENIAYSKRAGIPDIYLWGVEWWYYLDTTQGIPEFWQHAKTLF